MNMFASRLAVEFSVMLGRAEHAKLNFYSGRAVKQQERNLKKLMKRNKNTEYGKKYNELKASKKEEKDKIESELNEIKKKVDPALMERYLKKREEKLYPILFEVTGEFCSCCNMELSLADLSKLKNGEVIECDQCRRLLYKV